MRDAMAEAEVAENGAEGRGGEILVEILVLEGQPISSFRPREFFRSPQKGAVLIAGPTFKGPRIGFYAANTSGIDSQESPKWVFRGARTGRFKFWVVKVLVTPLRWFGRCFDGAFGESV